MTNTFVTLLECASDPWALALISFFFSGLIVVCGAIAFDSNRGYPYSTDPDFDPFVEPRKDDNFFDKITEFHDEI